MICPRVHSLLEFKSKVFVTTVDAQFSWKRYLTDVFFYPDSQNVLDISSRHRLTCKISSPMRTQYLNSIDACQISSVVINYYLTIGHWSNLCSFILNFCVVNYRLLKIPSDARYINSQEDKATSMYVLSPTDFYKRPEFHFPILNEKIVLAESPSDPVNVFLSYNGNTIVKEFEWLDIY